MAKMYLIKIYRYTKVEDPKGKGPAKYQRELWDSLTLDTRIGGLSSPIGPDEEFELWIDEIK